MDWIFGRHPSRRQGGHYSNPACKRYKGMDEPFSITEGKDRAKFRDIFSMKEWGFRRMMNVVVKYKSGQKMKLMWWGRFWLDVKCQQWWLLFLCCLAVQSFLIIHTFISSRQVVRVERVTWWVCGVSPQVELSVISIAVEGYSWPSTARLIHYVKIYRGKQSSRSSFWMAFQPRQT